MDEKGEVQKFGQVEWQKNPPVFSEAERVKNLVRVGARGPSIGFTWPRHIAYDFHKDGRLTADEIFLIPSGGGNPELQSLLEYSPYSAEEIARVLTDLPDSKIGRALTRYPTIRRSLSRSIMEICTQGSIQRAVSIIMCMRECPHTNNPYSTEGFRASRVLEQLPEEFRDNVLKQVEVNSPQYASNIRKNLERLTTWPPNQDDFPWSTELVSSSRTGELSRYNGKVEGKKIFQGQYSTSPSGENLQTFGLYDCVAIALLDSSGNKALAHMDTGMDHETSLDHIIFSFVEIGGDLTKTKLALVGGTESSREMIWRINERLRQAGLSVDITRLIEGDSQQLLVTDQGFYDFDVQYTREDITDMKTAFARVLNEGNCRLAQLV